MARIKSGHSMPRDVQKRMATARRREVEYSEVDPPKPPFSKWLRGKFGLTVADRHGF